MSYNVQVILAGRSGRGSGLGWVPWTGLGLCAPLLADDNPSVGLSRSQFLVASLALLFGVRAFWQHGGRQITTAGVYSLASAIFVGFAGLYWWSTQGPQLSGEILLATCACYFTHLWMFYGFWHRYALRPLPLATPRRTHGAIANGGLTVGAMVMIVGVIASAIGLNASWASPTAFAGMALMTVALFNQPRKRGIGIWRVAIVLVAFLLYARYVFSGFGRLNLATLAFLVAAAASVHLRGHAVKAFGLLICGPALYLFAILRESFGRDLYGPQGLNGIGSVVSPLATFAQLIEARPRLPLGGGSTLLGALVVQVPSQVWENKPPGFGRILAEIFQPDVVDDGGSMAALSPGEWLYNFGWIGIILMVPVLGYSIRLADRWLWRAVNRPVVTRANLISLCGALIAVSGIADLQWGGAQTFSGRTGTRLLVLLLVLLVWVRPNPASILGLQPRSDGRGGTGTEDATTSTASNIKAMR